MARAIGSATITFGMVAIPTKVYPSTDSAKTISFNNMHKSCRARMRQKNICESCKKEVGKDDIVKGYAISKDKYVIFETEEIKALEAQSTGEINIEEFVPLRKIDSRYFDKAYFLGTDKVGKQAYSLLCAALRKSKLAAIAKYATRGKEHLVCLRATKKGMILQQLHHHDELRDFADVGVELLDVDDAQLNVAMQIVAQSTSERFDAGKYKDEVRGRIEKLIDQKIAGEDIATAASKTAKAEVLDLMSALKASIEGKEKTG